MHVDRIAISGYGRVAPAHVAGNAPFGARIEVLLVRLLAVVALAGRAVSVPAAAEVGGAPAPGDLAVQRRLSDEVELPPPPVRPQVLGANRKIEARADRDRRDDVDPVRDVHQAKYRER